MVSQKRLVYGFKYYEPPTIPRATRSTRGAKFQRRVEDDQMGAFDLLAAVAGKLFFQDKENPTMPGDTSPEKVQNGFVKECQDADKRLEAEFYDEGNCDKKCLPHVYSQQNNHNSCMKEFPNPEIHVHSGIASVTTSSSSAERFAAEKFVDGKSLDEMENFTNKDILGSSGRPEVICCKLDGETNKLKDELNKLEKMPISPGTEMCSFENPVTEKPPALIGLGGNAKLCQLDDSIPSSSLSKGCDNEREVSRDNDENYFGCTHPSTNTKSFRPVSCLDDRRIRKLLACKYRKVAQEPKYDALCNRDGDLKPTYRSKKNCYKRQRSHLPFKKRKPFNYSSVLTVSNSNGFIRSGDVSYSPVNGMNQDASGSSPGRNEGPGIPSLKGQNSLLRCRRGAHVNIRIKSFRVPELFIEIPETATVASLKRTVMDAVTAVLGGGLRVGVILQGKKVRDDSKTLLQTGISHDNHLDALGFTLEPKSLSPVHASHSLDVPQVDMPHPLIRYPSSPAVTHSSDMLPENQVTSLGNLVESDHDSAPYPVNASADKGITGSKALVTVPEISKEELAVVPVAQKSKRSESLQRRIRRPFSVDEVEALVQAVEKLGTGRWRDVKRRAFDNADRRTYVDLKDKWKTLVHTARISPQQRRGEPVPQELLDRVLTAHAYWSHHQNNKPLIQNHPENTSLLFNQGLSTPRGYVHGVTA